MVFVSRFDLTVRPLPRVKPGAVAEAARAYAAAGIPIFPCVPGEKNPLTEHGFHDATTNPRQVEWWWRRTPTANIGIATGHGIDVLDIDMHTIGSGFALLRTLHRNGQTPGWAQAVRSPAGGVHLYYPSDPDREQRSWSRGTKHLDFRGVGGYIIAPPSTVLTDRGPRSYEVIARGRDPRPIDADAIRALLTPPPEPAITTRGAARGEANPEALAAWVARLPEGNRNSGLFWAACRLVEAGLSEAETRAVLEPAATATALDAREIAAMIRSAHRTVRVAPDSGGTSSHASAGLIGIGR